MSELSEAWEENVYFCGTCTCAHTTKQHGWGCCDVGGEPRRRWKVRPVFAWFDLWIGVFIDRPKHRVYVFPFPCVGVVISWRRDG